MNRIGRGMVVSIIAAGAAAVAGCERPEPKMAPPPPQTVFVGHPVVDEVTDYEDFTGRTDAVYSVEVRARVTGYLEKFHFKDGDDVKEGAPLFEIDARPYKAEFQRTKAVLEQAEAHLKRLEADYRRASNLIARGNISREEYDKIAGDRSEAEAAVGIARSQKDLAELNVGYTKINAPIAGRLSRRQVDPGNLVQADITPLTTIVSLDPMYVYFDIDERTLLRLRRLIREGKIKSRQQTEVTVYVALSDEEGYPHKGTIDFSENKVDPATGTLRARAKIDNPKPHLFSPGLFVRVRLPVGDPHRSTLVAEKALGSEQGEKYLYVVRDKTDAKGKAVKDEKGDPVKVAEKVRVKVGRLDGDRRVIESVLDNRTLRPEDLIVVEGLQRIRPGTAVEPKVVTAGTTRGAAPSSPAAPARPAIAQGAAPRT